MKTRLCLILLSLGLAIFLLGPLNPAGAASKVLTGKHVILYDIVNPVGVEFLPHYRNSSYTQKILQEDEFSKRVMIEVNLEPLNSSALFPASLQQLPADMKAFLQAEKDIPARDENIFSEAQKLARGSQTVHEAVSAIFHWIVDNHTYDAGRNTPQDGRSVFYNKRGSCVGFTNLSIAMLRSLGIPARYAHGYLPPGYEWGISKKYWGVQISGGGYHAWIEVYYPDVGWTFSDLLHSKNFVDPFHIVRYIDGINLNPRNVRGGTLDVEEATTFTIFKEENSTLAIDQFSQPKKDILARQSGKQQFGTIYGLIKDPSGKPVLKGSVVLWEGIQGKVIAFEKGLYTLLGLEDGTYRLTVKADGHGEVEKKLQATKGEVKNIDIVLPSASPSPASSPSPSKATPKSKKAPGTK
jgi:hypothetical protein